ncbi:MAG: pilin [Candidatus Paceibacterota bacterium]
MNKKIFGVVVSFVLMFTPFIFSTIIYNSTLKVEAISPFSSEVTLDVVSDSITLNSAKLRASGNITPGDYHFSVYEEAGYPKNRTSFQSAVDPITTKITGSFASTEVTISPLKPSTRYVGVLYKDNYDDISEVHFATLFDSRITLGTKNLTSTSVTLITLGTLDKDLYHFYIYDSTTSLANPLFTKDLSRTTESGLEATFSGLKPGHNYSGAIDFNMGAEYDQPVSPIQFKTPTSSTTTTPAVTTTPNSGVVPDCGKVVTTIGADGKETSVMNNPCTFKDLVQLLNNVIKFLLFSIATPLIALILMYTGYLYLTAGGSSGQTEKVRHILFNAVIGYVVALAAWLIVKTILSSLNIDPTIETFL